MARSGLGATPPPWGAGVDELNPVDWEWGRGGSPKGNQDTVSRRGKWARSATTTDGIADIIARVPGNELPGCQPSDLWFPGDPRIPSHPGHSLLHSQLLRGREAQASEFTPSLHAGPRLLKFCLQLPALLLTLQLFCQDAAFVPGFVLPRSLPEAWCRQQVGGQCAWSRSTAVPGNLAAGRWLEGGLLALSWRPPPPAPACALVTND